MPLPPGSPQGMVPRGEDWVVRRFEELERKTAADIASVAASFQSTAAHLADLIATQIVLDSGVTNTPGGGFTTTPTATSYVTINVPTGYASVNFFVGGTARAYNTSGSTQYLFVQIFGEVVGGVQAWGGTQQVTIANGFQATTGGFMTTNLAIPNLPGQQIRAWCSVSASATIAADPTNYVGTELTVTFSR